MSARGIKRKRSTSTQSKPAAGGKVQRGSKASESPAPAKGPEGPAFPLDIPRPLMRLVYKEQDLIEQEKQVSSPLPSPCMYFC
jgi:hypothetical protein